jgi:hypothetical protein
MKILVKYESITSPLCPFPSVLLFSPLQAVVMWQPIHKKRLFFRAKTHMNKNNLLFATTFALLTACSGGGDSGGGAPTGSASSGAGTAAATPAANTRIIDNEDMTAGLEGVDANKNGIRDDIDRLIALKYSGTPALKKAAEQTARSLQKFMEANSRQQVLAQGDENSRASACLAKVLLDKTKPENTKIFLSIGKEIVALTANTQERFTKYWSSSELAGGAVFEQPTEPVCD